MRSVILVPRRAGIPERDKAWEWCKARWQETLPDIPVYEGHHDDGPFNRSAAINLAARLADEDGRWDNAVIVDADIFIAAANVRQAIEVAHQTKHVAWAFGWWAGLSRVATENVVSGDLDPEQVIAKITALFDQGTPNEMGNVPVPERVPSMFDKVNPISWSCCFVVPREAFDRLGGFDERFAGWGWEDMAFQSAAVGLIGYERLPGAVIHLWHPRHPGLGQDGVNKRRNRQLGRRYMYALRMKGYHDRHLPADHEEMQRDRANLLRLMESEETDRKGRPAPDLPNWRGWLPSLEELVEGAKSQILPTPPVAIVVRTGGEPDNWPVRSAYLRRMLDSMDKHVRYDNVVARVIFSDWQEPFADELEAIAKEHGFYVASGADDGGPNFTRSMERLWRYIASRTWAFDYVFLAEDDFLYERDVSIAEMVQSLEANPHLVQMALLRDACYPAERAKGGILGHPMTEFEQIGENGTSWLEHRRFFTLNPTLIPRRIFLQPWPRTKNSEAIFGNRLFATKGTRSALWGRGEAWIRHLGEVRAGTGY